MGPKGPFPVPRPHGEAATRVPGGWTIASARWRHLPNWIPQRLVESMSIGPRFLAGHRLVRPQRRLFVWCSASSLRDDERIGRNSISEPWRWQAAEGAPCFESVFLGNFFPKMFIHTRGTGARLSLGCRSSRNIRLVMGSPLLWQSRTTVNLTRATRALSTSLLRTGEANFTAT